LALCSAQLSDDRLAVFDQAREKPDVGLSGQIHPVRRNCIARSPPFDTLELALERAKDLERGNKVTIHGIEGPDGQILLDREGYARRR